MARVARLAGALLLETAGAHYLVGQTKQPCDFARAGFETPVAMPTPEAPFVRLAPLAAPVLAPPWLLLEDTLEGEPLARALATRMLIERNASVSERLWRLVAGADDEGEIEGEEVAARWLTEAPDAVWQIVRDTVLRCL